MDGKDFCDAPAADAGHRVLPSEKRRTNEPGNRLSAVPGGPG